MIRTRAWFALIAAALSSPGLPYLHAQSPAPNKSALRKDAVVAGGPRDFMEVRHVVLEGANQAIGQALATIGKERFQLKPTPSADRLRTRVQRRYLADRYPILLERMRGIAAAFDKRLEDDGLDFGGLSYLVGPPGGCSVAYIPPGRMADGKGVLSRNYDFTTGTILDAVPRRGELPVNSRPYVIELHPDRGYASLAICSFDLLSGVLDGINEQGLTVSVVADDPGESKFPMEPAEDGNVGLDELQTVRMLLDTCATVEEAKEALLGTKQYYTFISVHYMIADRHGQSFVWEYSLARNREHIIENPGRPLVSTNFRMHEYLEENRPPSAQRTKAVCPRYSELSRRLAGRSEKMTVEFIKETHKAADIAVPAALFGTKAPTRTLWHALYYPEQRKLQVSFYLGDKPDPSRKGTTQIQRSDYVEFVLRSEK